MGCSVFSSRFGQSQEGDRNVETKKQILQQNILKHKTTDTSSIFFPPQLKQGQVWHKSESSVNWFHTHFLTDKYSTKKGLLLTKQLPWDCCI